MAKPTPMTDDGLKALVSRELRNAVGYFGGKLSDQRRKAEVYYLGLPKLDLAPPEIDGRSTVVSTDVRNTIESMLPQLMAKFVGGDAVVEFEPSQRGDEEKAKSCTDYMNYLFFKKNNGHAITYSWFKDALLQKNGIIKAWWDTRAEEKREEYKGLTEIELAQILDDPEVEPIEQSSRPDEEDAEQRQKAIEQLTQQIAQATQAASQPGPQQQQAAQAVQAMQQQLQQLQSMPPAMVYDVAFKRVLSRGRIAIENVPPEEFLISREAKTIATARMCGHRVPRTLSELRSMGYKNVDNIGSDDAAASLNAERIERLGWDDEMAYLAVDSSGDDSQRVVWCNEVYIRCDYDGDGIAELRKVVYAGNEILDNEECDVAPFVSICPVPLPHKFFGLSIADLAMESQKTKTNILRAQLDNMYLQVNGRYFAVNGQVNLDDLLTSRPGGIVRIDQPGAVGRLDQGMGDMSSSSGMMEWMEMNLEQSTGWTRYSQGNDSKALNQTATGVQIITNKGDMRVDLIARNFAEGFVELFRMMLKLISQHQDKAQQIKANGKWVDMDPREWRNQFDVNINVGLGIGSRDEQVHKLMALSQQQANAMAIGVARPDQVYNLLSDVAGLMGEKDPDRYFNNPKENPPPPRPDPEQAKAQAQMQIEQAKLQQGMALEKMKLDYQAQVDQLKRDQEAQNAALQAQMQQATDANRQEMEARQHQMKLQQEAQLESVKAQYDEAKHQREMQFQAWKVEKEQEFARWKAELDAATKLQSANITSTAKVDNPATQAATNEIASEVTQPAGIDFSPLTAAAQQMTEAAAMMTRPRKRTIVRDETGRATGMIDE